MPTKTSADADADADDAMAFDLPGRYNAVKQFGLVVLCAVWIMLGILGHDPWKAQDAVGFGVTQEMIERGDGLVLRLAGEPYVDNPPLVYLLAAGTGIALSPPLPLHDAARVSVALILALTLLLLAATATELNGRNYRWMAVLVFVGSVGLWERAHQISPELGLVLGIAAAQYGFALALRRPVAGGAMLGLGTGIAFLSVGPVGPVWIGLTAVALPAAFATWRTSRYAVGAAVATLIALGLGGIWLLALHLYAPLHLAAWWAAQSLGDFLAPLDPTATSDVSFLAKNLTWFAWPALPLVLWTIFTRARGFNGGFATAGVQLPATLALVIGLAIVAMGDPRLIILMPLLVPLTLLAVPEIQTLPRGFSGALDWFGILTFGLISLLLWWLWFASFAEGMPPAVARLFRDTEPGYRPPFHWAAFALSAFLTLLWLALVRPARRSNRRTLLNWAAGMTLVWALYSTIWLPYLDSRRSYRGVALSLRTALPREGCVASRNLGDAQRVLFRYFANLTTVRAETEPIEQCNALLVQFGRMDATPATPEGWQPIWTGRRRGDDTERYVLFSRKTP
jgi:4-amino-4-deoxy-L-arabinose transferase-like glycosyltransferase